MDFLIVLSIILATVIIASILLYAFVPLVKTNFIIMQHYDHLRVKKKNGKFFALKNWFKCSIRISHNVYHGLKRTLVHHFMCDCECTTYNFQVGLMTHYLYNLAGDIREDSDAFEHLADKLIVVYTLSDVRKHVSEKFFDNMMVCAVEFGHTT